MQETDRPTANSARAVRAYPVAPGRLLSAARLAAEGLPRWRLEASEGEEVRAVRTTRLSRFEAYVTARVSPAPGARVMLTSASRLGRNDLGQNPGAPPGPKPSPQQYKADKLKARACGAGPKRAERRKAPG